jgi:hypothetical protein
MVVGLQAGWEREITKRLKGEGIEGNNECYNIRGGCLQFNIGLVDC